MHPGSTVCVTGGLGFIGVHLCRHLRARGYEVVCADRLSGVYARGWGPEAVAGLEEEGVRVAEVDVAERVFERLLQGCDAAVHLAGLAGVRARHSAAALHAENVTAARRVAAIAARGGQRIVLASTSSVYGNACAATPESAARRPLNPYARSKAAAEDAWLGAVRGGADAVVARLFTVYGPGQRPDMAFAAWIGALARDEEILWCAPPGARRDFTYVHDAVRGLAAALERGRAGRVYNVGGCGPVAVHAALAEVEAAMGRTAPRRPEPAGVAEARVTAACGRRAARELGYTARTPLRAGIRAQVAAAAPALALALG